MLGNVFPVFVVVLSEHTFTDEYNLVSDLSLIQRNGSFGKLFTDQYTFYLPSSLYTHFRKAGIYNGIHSFS